MKLIVSFCFGILKVITHKFLYIFLITDSMNKTIVPYSEFDVLLCLWDEAYHLSWPTKVNDEQAFSEIRLFYETLRKTLGGSPREIQEKVRNGVELFGMNWHSPEMSLEEFLDVNEFQQILRRQVAFGANIGTPYGDFFYDMESSESKIIDGILIRERRMAFMSHLDLSTPLPSLIKSTHAGQLSEEQVARISMDLQGRLARYGK